MPESFNVLLKEIRSLGINIELEEASILLAQTGHCCRVKKTRQRIILTRQEQIVKIY